jgi:phosphate-selective porin
MRIVRIFLIVLAFACLALVVRAEGSGKNSPGEPAATGSSGASTEATKPADAAPAKAAPVAATREEVEELRAEVAELKAVIKKLMEAKGQPESPAAPAAVKAEAPASPAPSPAAAARAAQPAGAEADGDIDPLDIDGLLQASKGTAQQKPSGAPVTAGWNGEHFFIKSPDGQFQIQPYGYVQTDFRSYDGDGSPANTFAVRRARFGFQGNFGSHFQFAILTDAASSGTGAGGAIVRDVYLNAKITDEFQIQAGQFKEPFAQELVAGITNIDFVERGLQSLLYPSGVFAFRSPGAVIHGDIDKGVIQYWGGIFNGHGYGNASNTTSVPETVGRIRLYPWRNHKDSFFQALAFGGSVSYSYACGTCNEQTPRVTDPDAAFTFFPQFRINGNAWRGEGEFTFLHGPLGLRGEYVQAEFDRTGVGTLQFGGLGFQNLPTVRYKGYNISGTWLLTGEKRPENGTPRVKHPLFGPETPGGGGKGWGAFEVAVRYSGIQGNEPGCSSFPASTLTAQFPPCTFSPNVFTPELVPTYDFRTDEFTAGLNWYLNYWIRYQTNISVDRLRQPSTIGAVPQNYLVFEQRIQFRF